MPLVIRQVMRKMLKEGLKLHGAGAEREIFTHRLLSFG